MKRTTKKLVKGKPAKLVKQEPKTPTRGPMTQDAKVSKAKGRPMLQWVGKRPLDRVTAFPAQLVETYNPTGRSKGWENLLFHGDNKEVLAWLLTNGFRGKVNLIYIDPPFDSGADYVRKVQLRGVAGSAKLEGESYSLGEQIQYTDIWTNDTYLQFMYERLLLLKEILTDAGSIYLHCDYRRAHHLRLLMDEVFGEGSFVNEIIWLAEGGGTSGFRFSRKHQTLLYYSKAEHESQRTFNVDDVRVPYKTKNIKPQTYHYEANQKQRPAFKNGYTWTPNEAGKIPTDVWLELFLAEGEGIPLDIWYDVKGLYGPSGEILNYPTQKPESLLDRIVRASSKPGELVLDCFAGTGTTLAVAQTLGRRWIGCDINKGAVQLSSKRLQTIVRGQIEAIRSEQGRLTEPTVEGANAQDLTALAFEVYRVNDYDLQIQHNEAVNLACEHIGVERTRTDRYFDGKLGKRLVKITPFNHPLSPLDLEELKNELKARPDEDRDITVVCLAKETACVVWIEDWNRMRRQGRVPNQIEIIELRTDPKYGKFFLHRPAKAEVKIAKRKGKLIVEISDFLSPTIVERLSAQEGVLKPQITDWRSMVDTIMIDSAYNGEVFNIVLADVPERKTDLVVGSYELAAPKGNATVAVKITDMLGEEVLVTKQV